MKKKILKKIYISGFILSFLLMLASCGSEEANEVHAEQLAKLETAVNGLFNKKQDDLAGKMDENSFRSVEKMFHQVRQLEESFSDENRQQLKQLHQLFDRAFDMFNLETKVASLLVRTEEINEVDVEIVEERLAQYKDEAPFFNRISLEIKVLSDRIDEQLTFESQMKKIEKLLNIIIKNNEVSELVKKNDYEKLAHLVEDLADSEEKQQFEKNLQQINKN